MHNRERLIKAIDNSACLTRRQMDDYLQNKLFPEELYVVEMHLNECPFCDDALDGFAKSANANAYLSSASEFVVPVASSEVVPQKPAKKTVEEGVVASPKRAEKEVNVSKATDSPFNEESRKSKFPFTMAIAASIAVVLAAWGIFKWNRIDKIDANQAGNIANKLDDDGAAIQNKESIDRRQDSMMNEKYAFQNQDPLNGKSSVWVNQTRNRDGILQDSGQSVTGVQASADGTANAADVSSTAKTAASSSDFVGPKMPREEESRAAPVAKASAVKSKAEASTVASQRDKVAAEKDKKASSRKEKDDRANEVKAKEEKAKLDKVNSVMSQAEKDFSKGKELYNQKKFAASISYFQSAAKVKDYSKQKQAESFIKLAKSEVLKAEREKNSKK